MVTVFDGRRDRIPEMKDADPLNEHGNGLRIVTGLSAESGTHPSRSRIGPWPALGKTVWFSLALPQTWPTTYTAMTPGQAARRLHALLAARGLTGVIRADRAGVALVSVRHGITVWVEPGAFSLAGVDSDRIRRPLADLQEVAEIVVHHHERQGLTPGHRENAKFPAGP